MTAKDTENEIIQLEGEALRRWCDGDPSGFLQLSAPDVVYFDPMLDRRLDGLDALTKYYEPIEGKIKVKRFDMINPLVQMAGDAAVLTFNFVSFDANDVESRWNCTEVYRRTPKGWRIIQTHWSPTKPGIA